MSMQARRRRKRGVRRTVEDRSHDAALDAIIDLIFDARALGGAFEMPWRSGVNAARVVHHFLHQTGAGELMDLLNEAQGLLERSHVEADLATAYALASGLLHDSRSHPFAERIGYYVRLVQLYASRSHGGGHAYNAVLQQLAERLNVEEEAIFQDILMINRCHDAIGTGIHFTNDGHDRVRSAFRVLWRGGHHRAIYALPHLETT